MFGSVTLARNESRHERNETRLERNETRLERNETRLERNETRLERNETRLARNETRLARNETRGGNLHLSGTVGIENQNQSTSKSTNLAERKCSVAKRESWKIFLAMSYVDAILCRFLLKFEKEDGDEYEPDSGKENARFKKL